MTVGGCQVTALSASSHPTHDQSIAVGLAVHGGLGEPVVWRHSAAISGGTFCCVLFRPEEAPWHITAFCLQLPSALSYLLEVLAWYSLVTSAAPASLQVQLDVHGMLGRMYG